MNVPVDSFTHMFCSAVSSEKLMLLHNSLCHPGVTRMNHFVRMKNLAVSIEEIKTMTRSCKICAECKPRFFKPSKVHLIKATQPFERISIDFKGPLPSSSPNKHFLTVVDEYSRFPFLIPCRDVSTPSVIKSLCSIFSMFGMAGYVHLDRGSSFISKDLKDWLISKNIGTSKTNPYNACGNGQCERYNSTIWKAVALACKSQELDIEHWEVVLPDALHSIRSLLCTATNTTPHECLFNFPLRSMNGESVPTWLSNPGPVFLKRYVHRSKYEPLVDEVELIESNPNYAHIRYPNIC